jgi:hypothetical protein
MRNSELQASCDTFLRADGTLSKEQVQFDSGTIDRFTNDGYNAFLNLFHSFALDTVLWAQENQICSVWIVYWANESLHSEARPSGIRAFEVSWLTTRESFLDNLPYDRSRKFIISAAISVWWLTSWGRSLTALFHRRLSCYQNGLI